MHCSIPQVLVTIYWLGKAANSYTSYSGTTLNLKEFEGLLAQMRKVTWLFFLVQGDLDRVGKEHISLFVGLLHGRILQARDVWHSGMDCWPNQGYLGLMQLTLI